MFYGLKRPLTGLPPILGAAKSFTLRISSPGADKAALTAWATSLLVRKTR